MTATLTIQEYLQHFLLNRDREVALEARKKNDDPAENKQPFDRVQGGKYSDAHLPAVHKTKPVVQQNYGVMLCHVHQLYSGGHEELIYSKKITGNKNLDMFGSFAQDMIGAKGVKASQIPDGRMSRASSVSDISSILDPEDGELQPKTSVTVHLMASRSPSNVGSAHIQGLLDHCKRHSIRISIHLKFAHAFSWDNKYNKEGLEHLHEKGVKLIPMSFQQMLHCMVDDMKESLESLDQLETCRGAIYIDGTNINQAVSAIRQSLATRCDFYHQDQQEHLQEILGRTSHIPQYNQFSQSTLPAVFDLETYREYILLQNTDVNCGKLKIGITKIAGGVTKEESAYEFVKCDSSEKVNAKFTNSNKHKLLDHKLIWDKVGKKVSMVDLSECEDIVITVNMMLSEYSGRVGWVNEIIQLHGYLRDMIEDSELYKVRVETTVRYAQSVDAPVTVHKKKISNGADDGDLLVNGMTNGHQDTTVGFPRGMRLECLHVQDILFEMLEDLDDNLRYLVTLEYGRGANLYLDGEELAKAMGLLSKSIKIRTSEGEFSMTDEFLDQYADDMNGIC